MGYFGVPTRIYKSVFLGRKSSRIRVVTCIVLVVLYLWHKRDRYISDFFCYIDSVSFLSSGEKYKNAPVQ